MIRIAIADDHPAMIHGLRALIGSWPNMEVTREFHGLAQLERGITATEIDVLITDLYFGEDSSLAVVSKLHARFELPIVMYTMSRHGRVAHELLRAGALAYVSKADKIETLRLAIERAAERRRSIPEWLADYIIDHGPRVQAEALSAREHEVLAGLVHGHSPSQIAADSGISPSTVSTFLARIKRKLGLTTTSDLIRHGIESGLYAPRP